MIKLKQLIFEARKLNLDNAEDAAEFVIRKAWQLMDNEDRYSEHQLMLYVNNEYDITTLSEKFADKFFPNVTEPLYEFEKVICQKLQSLEGIYNTRRKSKINVNDPLFILKKLVIRKSYNKAKSDLLKMSLSGGPGITWQNYDESEIDNMFARLYRIAHGETQYNIDNKYEKLSSIRRGDDQSVNMFMDVYLPPSKSSFVDDVTVYRGTNSPAATIRPGDYVTLSRNYAGGYMRGKYGAVITSKISPNDLRVDRLDLDGPHLIYWPEGHTIKKYEGNIPTFKEFWIEVNQT